MYILLIASNIVEILESIFTFFINLFYSAVVYNLYFQRDKIKLVIENLRKITYSQMHNENCRKMVMKSSKAIIVISSSLWVFTGLATMIYMSMPFWYEMDIENKTINKPLPYHSWYPYDKNKAPYYQISFVLEFFRGVGISNIVTGNDCLFTLILFYTFGQYNILRENIQNIHKEARENVKLKYGCKKLEDKIWFQEMLTQEANLLLNENIQHHIVLNKYRILL